MDAQAGTLRWFPADVDVAARRIQFLPLDEASLQRASFLDNRLDVDWSAGRLLDFDSFRAEATRSREDASRSPAWLWHTSFCGSTLLARMLHVPPHSTSLKEPLVLRRLSDAAEAGRDIDEPLRLLLPLLARPWHRDGTVLVKPTHAALNIARQVMARMPEGRALVLTSSLEDFLVSNLKKPPSTLAKVPQLVERAMGATRLVQRLTPAAFEPPGTLAMVALQWAAQRELVAELRGSAGPERVRIVDWNDLQRDGFAMVSDCARWLDLRIPEDALRTNIAVNAGRHSKSTTHAFDVATRNAEAQALAARYAPQIREAMDWTGKHLLPAMSPEALTTQSG